MEASQLVFQLETSGTDGQHDELTLPLNAQGRERIQNGILHRFAGDELDFLYVAQQTVQIAAAHQLSLVQETDAVADVFHFLLIVTGQNSDQPPVAGLLTENPFEAVPHNGIEAVKGLITQKNLRIPGQPQTDLRPFLRPFGKSGDSLMKRERKAQAELRQFIIAVSGIERRLHPRHFRNGGIHQESGFIAEIADGLFAGGILRNGHDVQGNLSLIGPEQPGHSAEKRGFSGSVGAQEAEDMPRLQSETDIVKSSSGTEGLLNMVGFQQEDSSLYTLLTSA